MKNIVISEKQLEFLTNSVKDNVNEEHKTGSYMAKQQLFTIAIMAYKMGKKCLTMNNLKIGWKLKLLNQNKVLLHDRIIRSVSAGIVMGVLGLGLILTGFWVPFDDDGGFRILGAICLSLGVGFLLSSVASYRVAKTLGVLDESAGRQTGTGR